MTQVLAPLYALPNSVIAEHSRHYVGTVQPSWELGYGARATLTAEHGMTNSGTSVTTAAAKTGFLATATNPFPKRDASSGRIMLPCSGRNWCFIEPIGYGPDNSDFPMALWAWRKLASSGGNALDVEEWYPDPIVHLTPKTCVKTGIAGGRIGTSWRFCDQFGTEVYRGMHTTGFRSSEHPTAPDDSACYFWFDMGGAQFIEVEGAVGSALSRWNFLWAMI